MKIRSSSISTEIFAEAKKEKLQSFAVNGLFLLTFVYIGKIQELFGFLSKIGFGKIVMAICLLLYFTSPPNRYSVKLFSLSQVKYVTGIFIIGIASIPWSAWPGQSFNFIFFNFSKTLIFFLLIVKVVNSSKDLKKLNWALISAVFLLSVFTVISGKTGRVSVTGTYDPNDLALVLVMSLPIVYFLAGNEYGFKKVGLFLLLGLLIIAIMKTGSRGGFLGLLITGFLILVRDSKRKWATKLLILAVLGMLLYLLAPGSYWQRMNTMLHSESDYNLTSGAGRIEIWKRGINLMIAHPFLGSGAGAFTVAEGEMHKEEGGKWSTAHNSFIQIGVELGIVGLFFFIALIFGSIQTLQKLRRRILLDPIQVNDYLWLVNGIEISLMAFCVSGFFLSQAYSSLLYFLIANVIVLKKIELTQFGEPVQHT